MFIGYGLAEFELLDFVFTKFEINRKHFILLPFYRDEVNILNYEQLYYNQMGITVKPYRKDINGYGQLCEVMKEWSSRINQVSAYLDDSFIEIDKAIEDPVNDNIARVLRTINNEKPLENYLFRQLSSSKNLTPWLIPLKESGYMNPSKNPSPENVPGTSSYNILYYLEKLAKTNSENPSNAVTKELCNFIDSAIDYRDKDGNRKDDLYIYWSIEILSYLPIQYIQQKHVDFIRIALETRRDNTLIATAIGESYIPNLIRSKAKELLLNSLNVVMDYKKENGNYKPLMNEYRFLNMTKMNKEQIAKLCGIEATGIALEKIKTIIKENESEFNIYKIRTIEPNSQKELQRNYSGILVYFIRDMYELSDANQIRPKVDELLKMWHPIFRRLAIHIINHHYDKLSDLFWNLAYNPLDDDLVKHETYELLKKRCTLFDEQQTDRIIDWIESKNYSRFDEIKDKNEKERVIAYRKREWLSALLESKNPKVVERYEEYTKINDRELDHPGHLFWTEFSWGDVSPIKANELIDMSNSQISDYLNNFKEEKFSLKSPTKDGLSDELHGGATINPDKFSSDMKPFKNISLEYQNAILSGLCRAWDQGKFFNWSELLDFSLEIIQIEEFWNQTIPEDGQGYRDWVISAIAELINEGTKKDDHAMDENLLPKAEEILLILVNNTKSGIEKEEDAIEATMNTPKGKIFEAMMNYSLHFAQINKKPKGERWITSIKEEFNKRLDRKFDPSLEFSVILGQFLHNLFYLDDSWLKDNINRIFPKDNDEHWHVAFTGYLLSTRSVYKEIYLLLKNKGHYSKAITTQFNAKSVGKYAMEQCVQHICVVYLENLENIDDNESLINQLLHNINPEQLSELINYISGIQDDLKVKSKEKLKPLWKRMIEILSPHRNEPVYQKVLSETSKFLSLVERIDDETFEWLKLSAKCFSDVYNLDYFIEALTTHAKKTPNYVGEIYIEFLKSEKYPDYPENYTFAVLNN